MKKFVYATGVLLWLLTGCDLDQLQTDDIENPTVRSIIAVPLGNASFTLRDLITQTGDSTVVIEEDSASSLLSLVYTNSFTYTSDADILSTDDITNSGSLNLLATPAVPSTTSVPFAQVYDFSFSTGDEDRQLDSVFFERGTLQFSLTNPLASVISYNASIDGVVSPAGQAVTISGAAANGTDIRNQDLAGYKLVLTEAASGNTTFRLVLSGDVVLQAGESIPAGQQLAFSVSFLDQEFDIVYGDFGSKTVRLGQNEGLEVDFFNSLFGEDAIEFLEPELSMTFRNSIGIPMGINFGTFSGQKRDEAGNITRELSLEGSVANSPQVIGFPTVNQVGQTISSTIEINRNNSTLPDLLSFGPNFLNLDLSATTNPTGITEQNFFDPDFTTIETDIEFRLPMIMSINDLEYETDYNIDIDELKFREDSDQEREIDSVSLRIYSSNLLPVNGTIDFQILDEIDTVIFEVPEIQSIRSALLLEGITRVPRPTTSDIPLGMEGIEALENGSKIRLVITLATPQTQNSTQIFPQFLANYNLDITISVLAKLNLEFD